MRYIILRRGEFISGFYYNLSESKRGLERYIASQQKRYPADMLRETLRIVAQPDYELPSALLGVLRDEIYRRIERDTVGAIYSKPLLESHIRTRIFGLNGHYYEVTPIARVQALTALLSSNAIKESGGILTRTSEKIELHASIPGLRSYSTQRA